MAIIALAILLALVPFVLPAQSIDPPAGSTVVLRAHGQGDQIYTCQQNAYAFSWVLKAPDARLMDDSGRVIGRHFAGPTWQLNDGSQVVGRPVARADAKEPASVPWLLLVSASTGGHGLLEHVRTIQRVDTHGGQPPAAGCDQSHVGVDTRVPYTAVYVFYD
jgi:Protein of unknown function (DUF3455)